MKKKFYLLFFIFVLLITGCTAGKKIYQIDNKKYVAKGKNERIQFIVIHYTAGSNEASIRELTSERVSSHFLIPSGKDEKIYNLVPENERAWHAGVSAFRGRTNINDTSIGIEIVNEGIYEKYRNYETYNLYEHYVDYEEMQIEKVAQLIKDLSLKYKIPARNILAHSDIAPSRKKDPGAKFPWKRLYDEYQIGAWYEEEDKLLFMNQEEFSKKSIKELKQELKDYGYEINDTDEWDKQSRDVIYAFQLHFNPKNLSAEMDLETYAILKALNKKYLHKK
ncbi:MAG: N-acetylmuramoyl-L-alanine amidase [Fusobacterium sp.]|uniref:N-acetylmuramoyl-L-alanine amidase n=1 Tax=Fusobacterium sp. TaxID=68766 RepID=UPI0026DAF200|nr:N-acetylmuramoyl-L-alanine amidase [Fusobacterium sp.]MDO4689787.1 N-acetylmuramoyl-L-alanine amidase [Fusobacterium sp.]